MIARYSNPEITRLSSLPAKYERWQTVELAVVRALVLLKRAPQGTVERMEQLLSSRQIDAAFIDEVEKETHHDFNAFLKERRRFLDPDLHQFFHPDTTSYDTEEPAFTLTLRDCLKVVETMLSKFEESLVVQARRYRFTLMYARTHGQGGKMQTYGKRCLTHLADFRNTRATLRQAAGILQHSKLSGAVGNYGGGQLDPELEAATLSILDMRPYYGATQIMPRSAYAPLGNALAVIVQVVNRVALDLRLAARSGRPIYQEPFGEQQMGSSAMPHKRNTIGGENTQGMARLAVIYSLATLLNIETWEERSIEQSSVERVVWPDLFHVVCHSLKTMTRVLGKLQVNPDQMMNELYEARGCYASDEAKSELTRWGSKYGLTSGDAYGIVQVAAFMVHAPSTNAVLMRSNPDTEYPEWVFQSKEREWDTIENVIQGARLTTVPQLKFTQDQIQKWNEILQKIFTDPDVGSQWPKVFNPHHLLRNESSLYHVILGE